MRPFTKSLMYKLAMLAYTAWSEAYDDLKRVKEETDDGEKDWKLFHDARLKFATEAEQEAKKVCDEAIAVYASLGE